MDRRRRIAWYRAGFGMLAVATVGFLYVHNRQDPEFSATNYLSFFTIQSNLFAAGVLLYGAWRSGGQPSRSVDLVRGAAVLYMATTGAVYGVLLVGYAEELGTAVAWADTVVHRVMPLVLVADWLIDPPRTRLTVSQGLVWLVYPFAFVIYSLLRGPRVDWYPYPFLDPVESGGYIGVAVYSVVITAFLIFGAWCTVAVGNWQRGLRVDRGVAGPATAERLTPS